MSSANPYDPSNPRHRVVRYESGVFTPLDGRAAPVAGDELFNERHIHYGTVTRGTPENVPWLSLPAATSA